MCQVRVNECHSVDMNFTRLETFLIGWTDLIMRARYVLAAAGADGCLADRTASWSQD